MDKKSEKMTGFDPVKYVKQGYWYDEESGTLCICDHELIEQLC